MKTGLLHHVEINVSDLQEAREFYNEFFEKLGYNLFQEWEKGFSMKLGETYIVFVQTEERFLQKKYHRKQTGLNHLAFHVENKKAVDEWTEWLNRRECKILYKDKHPYAGGSDHYAV